MKEALLAYDFDDIRPYYDEEIQSACEDLLRDPQIRSLLPKVLPSMDAGTLKQLLKELHSIEDFKKKVSLPILTLLVEKTCFSLSASGMSQLEPQEPYLFISNHRDIVLDASLLSVLLHHRGKLFPRIAIGDNLMITENIRKLVRINNSFLVKRSPDLREKLAESRKLSAYILKSLLLENSSVWIAQREGRAKDSDDKTQPAMLKMLCMASEESIIDTLLALKITPVCISYEYDPCDYLKATELLQRSLDPSFQKKPEDDYLNMKTGLQGFKGRVHFAVAPPLGQELLDPLRELPRAACLEAVAQLIDRSIHQRYRLYPINYIAADKLSSKASYRRMYSSDEAEAFEAYLAERIKKSGTPEGHHPFVYQRLLEMYANPLINHDKASREP